MTGEKKGRHAALVVLTSLGILCAVAALVYPIWPVASRSLRWRRAFYQRCPDDINAEIRKCASAPDRDHSYCDWLLRRALCHWAPRNGVDVGKACLEIAGEMDCLKSLQEGP